MPALQSAFPSWLRSRGEQRAGEFKCPAVPQRSPWIPSGGQGATPLRRCVPDSRKAIKQSASLFACRAPAAQQENQPSPRRRDRCKHQNARTYQQDHKTARIPNQATNSRIIPASPKSIVSLKKARGINRMASFATAVMPIKNAITHSLAGRWSSGPRHRTVPRLPGSHRPVAVHALPPADGG